MAEALQPVVLVAGLAPDESVRIEDILVRNGFRVCRADRGDTALDAVYADPPNCLLIDYSCAPPGKDSFLTELKADNVYGHLPAALLIDASGLEQGDDWLGGPADDFLLRPFSDTELVSRIRLCIARAQRDINANPLTGLPGNLTIMREAERRVAAGKPFALAYLDIDNFKPFNDKYGFSRGDEVLRMLARVLVNAVRTVDANDSYVGHIGGDDFVFMVPPQAIVKACKDVIKNFDSIIPNFYDEDDRVVGNIQSVDRKGAVQTFALMSISISAIDTGSVAVNHLANLSSRAAEIKQYAKQLPGSNFIIDRRK